MKQKMNIYSLKRWLALSNNNLIFYNCIYFSSKHCSLNNPDLFKVSKKDLFDYNTFLEKSTEKYLKYLKSIVDSNFDINEILIDKEYVFNPGYVYSLKVKNNLTEILFDFLIKKENVLKECQIFILLLKNEDTNSIVKFTDGFNIWKKYNKIEDFNNTFAAHTIFIDFKSKTYSTEGSFMKKYQDLNEIKYCTFNTINNFNIKTTTGFFISGKIL